MTVLTLDRLELDTLDWEEMDAFHDRVIFQTREWLDFVRRTQQAEPVVAAILDDGRRVGYFTGLVVRRFGVRILGSPFPGWTTDSMGFNLEEHVSRRDAASALVRFAFGSLRCAHVELKDRRLQGADLDGLGFTSSPWLTYEVDLSGDEPAILDRMSKACRRTVRRAESVGVTVERATGTAFADEYYAQLRAVFARQSLVPTYTVDRVRELIECVEPTGRLLLLRARSPDGRPIATAIFPAFNGTAYFWGGASVREDGVHRQRQDGANEAIMWHAMRYWRDRGATALDLGGAGDYKRRYGPHEVWMNVNRRSRIPALPLMRNLARRAVKTRQAWSGRRQRLT